MDISRNMIKAILFDLDDLMVNSSPLHFEASRRAFKRYGIDISEISDEVMATFFGKRTCEIQRLIAEHFGLSPDVDIEKLIEEREDIFLDLVKMELEPMPGLSALVDTVRSMSIKRAVASSGLRRYIDTALDKFGLAAFFHVIVSGDVVKNGKPHPEIFLKAAALLKVDPKSCLVIEDSTAGVEAAKKAGMYCIGVVNPLSQYKQDLSKADKVVNSLDQVRAEDIGSFKKKQNHRVHRGIY